MVHNKVPSWYRWGEQSAAHHSWPAGSIGACKTSSNFCATAAAIASLLSALR